MSVGLIFESVRGIGKYVQNTLAGKKIANHHISVFATA